MQVSGPCELNVFDKEEYDPKGMYYGRRVSGISQTNSVVSVKVEEGCEIFYTNSNPFSRFDEFKQKYTESVKILEIKEDSIVVSHQGYQEFVFVIERLVDTSKPFEIKVGETLCLYTTTYDSQSMYYIKVKEILDEHTFDFLFQNKENYGI